MLKFKIEKAQLKIELFHFCTGGRTRTGTWCEPDWILSPARLPIPPLWHVVLDDGVSQLSMDPSLRYKLIGTLSIGGRPCNLNAISFLFD